MPKECLSSRNFKFQFGYVIHITFNMSSFKNKPLMYKVTKPFHIHNIYQTSMVGPKPQLEMETHYSTSGQKNTPSLTPSAFRSLGLPYMNLGSNIFCVTLRGWTNQHYNPIEIDKTTLNFDSSYYSILRAWNISYTVLNVKHMN